jgi:hypothetical protein
MEYGIYGAVATVAIGIIVHAIRATWALSRVEKELKDYFDAQIDNVLRDVVKLERAGAERAETLRHEFGETGAALRTKIHEVETWNRDTFVRKESFEMVIGRVEKSMEKAVDKIEKRLETMFEKLQQKLD